MIGEIIAEEHVEERFFMDSVVRGLVSCVHMKSRNWQGVYMRTGFGNLHDPYSVSIVHSSGQCNSCTCSLNNISFMLVFIRRNGILLCQVVAEDNVVP